MAIRIKVKGHSVRVMEGPYTKDGAATPEAEAFAAELVGKLPEMKKFATRELLETFNDSWAEDEEDELSAAEFEANLVSPEIVIYDEAGAASVYFGDSDMFGGHLIDVSVNNSQISDASIAG